jgi:hypothetical protein
MSIGISNVGAKSAQSIHQKPSLPVWDVPSKMAFHIVYDVKNGPKHPAIRRPYKDTSRPANPRRDFQLHETRQILDDLMPEGCQYGIVSFESGGSKAQRKEMRKTAEWLTHGWTCDGIRYRCIYGHVPDDGFMLFVTANSTVTSIEDLGLSVSSDPKAAKRVRRFFAAHSQMCKGRIVDSIPADDNLGMAYAVQLADGQLITVLDFNMDLLDEAQISLKEGSGTCSLPGFDGAIATFGGLMGQGKGITAHNQLVWKWDVVLYDSKKEAIFQNGNFYFGVLSHTGLHPFKMDLQTLTNTGLYEDHLVTQAGLARMDELAELYSSDDEDRIISDFASTVRAVDSVADDDTPTWPLIRAIHLDHQSKTMPVLMRRMFNHGVQECVDITRGRVHIKNGFRGYAFPNPLIDSPDGIPIVANDTLAGIHEGLRRVCAPDAPEGRIAAGRSPNTHSGEIMELWNVHLPELMDYKGQGRVFFGRDAGEILVHFNGGDMDDMIFVFWGEEYLAKFRTMSYPVQPRIKVQRAAAQSEYGQLNKKRWKGIGPRWTPNVFYEQLKEFERGSESLGSFINRGWIDTLLSGEHRAAINACLEEKRYALPTNFQAPSHEKLIEHVGPEILECVGVYDVTKEGFVEVCKAFNALKDDFVTAMAMSNSDVVIDWLQMKKGSKSAVLQLIDNSMKALKTPFFPMCFASRVPRERREAGDYILVETKLCRALDILKARRDQLLEDNRQLEHLIKRPMAQALLKAYPADDRIIRIASQLTSWWRRQFDIARREFNGVVPPQTFKDAAYGSWDAIEVALPNGQIAMKEIWRPGLLDLYLNPFDESAPGVLEPRGEQPRSVIMRRQIAIHLANSRYTDDREPNINDDGYTVSVGDGILINEIINDILDAEEELGITGHIEFIELTAYARKKLVDGDQLVVKAVNGNVLHMGNDRPLSKNARPSLPNGTYLMNHMGIIRVSDAVPELKSNYLTRTVAQRESGFTFDADPTVSRSTVSASR